MAGSQCDSSKGNRQEYRSYKSYNGFAKNSKDFVAKFYAEGRWQYSLQQILTELQNNFEKSIKSSTNKSAIGKFYDDDYTLGPFDIGTINLILIFQISPE